MKYLGSRPMTFGMASKAYSDSPLWKKCGMCGKEFMGDESLNKHTVETHNMCNKCDGTGWKQCGSHPCSGCIRCKCMEATNG